MEWTEPGILLTCKPYGETAAIAHIMARENGRYAGLVYGATSRRIAPILQSGNQFKVKWRAKSEDNLGWFNLELETSRSVAAWTDRLALAGLTSVCALLDLLVPERMAYPELYDATIELLDAIMQDRAWPTRYGLWEKQLVTTIGFGLELDRCAVTGATENLLYISPKTGRAVSPEGAGEWVDRLLPLPPCYRTGQPASADEVLDCLQTSGHFINKALQSVSSRLRQPAARTRLVAMLVDRDASRLTADPG